MNQDLSTMATIMAAQNAGKGTAVYYVNALPGFTSVMALFLLLFVVCVVYGIIKFFTDNNKGE